MTTKVTEISKEALQPVVDARNKAVELAQAAQEAIKNGRLAELEFKVQIQQLYLEKGLDANCRVDITTGAVTWPEDIVEEETATQEAPPPKRKRVPKKKAEQAEASE